MNIHEYQAKEILKKYGLELPEGILALNADEAVEAASKIKSKVWVLKAQVHAGGRGKAGGVKLAKTLDEVRDIASNMIGMKLVTPQTGAEGKIVSKIYVEAGSDIKKEYYVSVVLDRNNNCITIAASTEGGMDIEEVAKNSPEKIIAVTVDYTIGLQNFHIAKLGFGMRLDKVQLKNFAKVVRALYNSFIDTDASQIEINPLIETNDSKFIPLDAKFNFDDNALYKHPEIEKMRDIAEEDSQEVEARKYDLSYVKMDGSIGCMVNGAGLAMATMDIIKLHGGSPANFLDVGGGADLDGMIQALRLLNEDSQVESILVNIFGGILRCDVLVQAIIQGTEKYNLKKPIVLRLKGTNSEIASELINKSNLSNIRSCNDLDKATRMVLNKNI